MGDQSRSRKSDWNAERCGLVLFLLLVWHRTTFSSAMGQVACERTKAYVFYVEVGQTGAEGFQFVNDSDFSRTWAAAS